MKTLPAFLLLLSVLRAGAQQSPNDRLRMVVAEAKRLYRSEKTSWIGSDMARLKLDSPGKAGAYFSYPEGQLDHFIAYQAGTDPMVVGELILDLKADTAMGSFLVDERPFTPREREYYRVREAAQRALQDTKFFHSEPGASFNIIPLIDSLGTRAYVLNASAEPGTVIIGNDYLLRFDDTLALADRRSIHNNAVVFRRGNRRSDGTMHIHLASSGEFMTATDLCTFMLYSPLLQWKKHTVISPSFLTTWLADTQEIKLSNNPFE